MPQSSAPLNGLKVLEIAGLAPAPFAGMVLADFGADVIRVDRTNEFNIDILTRYIYFPNPEIPHHQTPLFNPTSIPHPQRHKRSIALNFKNPDGHSTFIRLVQHADVVIEPFRSGVMEKLGLGPDVLCKANPRLVYARLSGYGQTGKSALVAGHDINYVAMSGLLSMLGRQGENPSPPLNIVGKYNVSAVCPLDSRVLLTPIYPSFTMSPAADFAGGGLMCVMGILLALIERQRSGKGQVVDAGMTAGVSYLSTFPYAMRKTGLQWTEERGTNLLDGGAPFYNVYRTMDKKFVAGRPRAAILRCPSQRPGPGSVQPPAANRHSVLAVHEGALRRSVRVAHTGRVDAGVRGDGRLRDARTRIRVHGRGRHRREDEGAEAGAGAEFVADACPGLWGGGRVLGGWEG
ncbi:CoA-transferase family III domain-containing protein [Jimgerdemannia flammicorona]|uniref:CoA-transferase family III domain-containing protein n=1 Tax=Jimgerdemannia flammicorona TaxID=994334 RepID=A0A433BKA0_9FUNG|nr:CoA-transferase family III domain-containing protein [Jimgerdemannia flammicorona]